MSDDQNSTRSLGSNTWLVDEMYEQYLADPTAVSATWQEFFADYRPPGANITGVVSAAVATAPAPAPTAPATNAAAAPAPAPSAGQTLATPAANAVAAGTTATASAPSATPATPEAPEAPVAPVAPVAPEGEPIRGVAAKIAQNMEASLAVPTATSFREVPARLLEVNRNVINGYLGRTRGGKVSFTHIIGYAIVRAVADHLPQINNAYLEGPDGKPRLLKDRPVNLGLAIDQEKKDGTRSLIVPVIKGADAMDFQTFVAAYDELVRKATTNKLAVDDFAGATITLTNPGTIGTERSVPRLMPGQGAIIGVGSLTYPTGFAAADPRTIADLGISKVMTISSTYDHRIIQGAESGLFLKKVNELLLGQDAFYDDLFRSIGVPYTAVQWNRDDNPVDREQGAIEKQMKVANLINMYRVRGHLIADLDPLAAEPPQMHPELDPAFYGLTIWDLEREFLTGFNSGVYAPVGGRERMKLGDILGVLRDAYCRTVGIEYTHITSTEEKRWVQEQVEGAKQTLDHDEQRHILNTLNEAEALEKFLATKWMGQKRFGLEGAESTIAILDTILDDAAERDMAGAVLGMAHRGRLNVLVNIVGKSYSKLFKEFEGHVDPDSIQGSGDVKYHLGQTGVFTARSGKTISVEMAANPSHLETVNPVVEGMARAKMDAIPEGQAGVRYPVLPILLHGDAAFAGQGVVAETLNLSLIKGYRVGGTIHVIINNQLGFTTDPSAARSSEYCTDVAKTVQAPIFHVNGDDPEACVRVARLALAYRQRFNKDVVIDMVCYRRHGHNEGDDPSYTQPLMYRQIDARRSVRKIYTESLVRRGDITVEEAEHFLEGFNNRLQQALEETRQSAPIGEVIAKPHPPAKGVLPKAHTAVSKETLDQVYAALSTVPEGFTIHPKLARQFETRTQMYQGGEVDWALGEAFAFGTTLAEGTSIRLTGQDSRRGTFSHRHSTLVNYANGDEFVPLSLLATGDTKLWIYDSLLSEYAVLGFEYGYSVTNPSALVLWEAQFGDFMNGAQIVIDQYIVSGEDKWNQTSGLVMLLPHGYEGQGPEHSSARIERFMTLAAEDNIQIANPTNAAQFFHLLRRQMHRDVRKPLIVFTPKSGIRSKAYRSPVEDFVSGTFEELLGDRSGIDPNAVTRLVLASGKVGHDAIAKRDELGVNMAVARVEQLFPWPYGAIKAELARYPNCTEIVWLQEEPENMGPWNGMKGRLFEAHGHQYEIRRVSRSEGGSPATGKAAIHAQEQAEILERAFAPLPQRELGQFH
ncbi:MAG: multifunctional oxoglutarate decarboxylase/oxoglutarate dehydrogenase thiamine pyrophosphate-binding subunit/dihydrolipoyllysine-residue succinyltransferase subunit [Actinobacteria bacterium]|nr:multifunctional oxoglutarate decarboxylase/oxoglutarate dehydrogenase thiamine pyrophosphate-binding subunit/dihydrolipoyllysine-residue succinyltransferase subunit [Actinomycetota bacterium]